jgi:hypothetical protein
MRIRASTSRVIAYKSTLHGRHIGQARLWVSSFLNMRASLLLPRGRDRRHKEQKCSGYYLFQEEDTKVQIGFLPHPL